MSVLAAGCRVGVKHDGSPGIGVYGESLRGSPRHRGSAAASVDYCRGASGNGDRSHGDLAHGRKACPVEV